MKKFRLLFMLSAAAVLSFTACQKSEGGSSAPAEPTVVEFYVDATMGMGELANSMSLADIGHPGHMFMLNAVTWNEETEMMVPCGEAMLMMFDYDYQASGLSTYSYLTGHHYPVVAGYFEGGNIPSSSCVLADEGGYSYFNINGVDYQIVVPETDVDADGMPYGITVEYHPGLTMQDLNYLVFNVPAKDADGNRVIIRGAYTGPLGYNLGAGGGAAKQTLPFILGDWGLTTFEATYNEEYNTLALVSSNTAGTFRMNFNLRETEGKFLDQTFTALEGGAGSITGFFEDFEETRWDIDTGSVRVTATDTAGVYNLVVSERAPLFFYGDRSFYEMAGGEYTITVNNLPEGL